MLKHYQCSTIFIIAIYFLNVWNIYLQSAPQLSSSANIKEMKDKKLLSPSVKYIHTKKKNIGWVQFLTKRYCLQHLFLSLLSKLYWSLKWWKIINKWILWLSAYFVYFLRNIYLESVLHVTFSAHINNKKLFSCSRINWYYYKLITININLFKKALSPAYIFSEF